jgi:hypothetical protein
MASISLLCQVDVKSIPITENESVISIKEFKHTVGYYLQVPFFETWLMASDMSSYGQVVQRTVTRRHINKNNI